MTSRPASEPPRVLLTDRVAASLRDRILAGEFGTDGRMPSEAAVVEEFSVSRIIARNAYLQLIEEGLVTTAEREGYFAHLPEPVLLSAASAGELPGAERWEETVKEAGRTPRTDVSVEVLGDDGRIPEFVRRQLAAGRGELLVLRDRVCWAGDMPLMLRRSWYRESLARGTALMNPAEQPGPGGLLAGIAAVTRTEDFARARMPDREEVRRLYLPRVTPVLDWVRVSYGEDGPLAVGQTLLPGDRAALAGHIS